MSGSFASKEERDAYLDQLVAEMEALRKDNDEKTKAMAIRIDRSLELARKAAKKDDGTPPAS